MSCLSIAAYFPFRRVTVCAQHVASQCDIAQIDVRPDLRFTPRCHLCGGAAPGVHSSHTRAVRDLDFATARVLLRYSYRKVFCPHCRQTVVEDLDVVDPWQRVTRRMARYVHELCKVMTVSAASEHLGLDWKTVRAIDKGFLEEEYGETDYEGLRLLAVDEIALKKGHSYMTVVIDYETGRVVWMGSGRSKETLRAFFEGMSEEQKASVEAVAMDMHRPYIAAVEESVPHAKIVFDLFHVVAAFGRVIDKVRLSEYRKASAAERDVIKGSKYLLLKRTLTSPEKQHHLEELLALNDTLSRVYILRDLLRRIWGYVYRAWAAKALAAWCEMAREVRHPEVTRFAAMLERHREGILNHCEYPIHTSKIEGANNKIKVIKRDAYGYEDERYFTLKVKQAFDPKPSTN